MARKKEKKPETEVEIKRAIESLMIEYELDVVDKQILNLLSQDLMLTTRDIAAKVGMTYPSIAKRMKKRGFILAYEHITQTTAQIMENNAKKAARRIGRFIEDDEKKIALEACKIALSPYLNQHTHVVTQQNVMVYKTTVQPDGSLLQAVIEADTIENSPETLQTAP
jgi:uncharacterized protein YaiI (UPF0178 family)